MRDTLNATILGLMAVPVWFGSASAADLEIQRLSLHQYEDGPVVAASYEYLPGEPAWVSARVVGFQTEAVDDEEEEDVRRVSLGWRVETFDPDGLGLEEPQTGRIEERLARQDEDWTPKIVAHFTVPPFAPEGIYRIPVMVTDDLAGTEASAELTFRVRGSTVPEAGSLRLRDFRYLAHEDDRFALSPTIYHPGDTLFAKFEIVGFQLGDNNQFAVNYGLTALGPNDVEMFTQPVAAEDSDEGYYPQRWVPGGFSLNLDDDIFPGNYAIRITVRDTLSGASEEFRQPFRIQ